MPQLHRSQTMFEIAHGLDKQLIFAMLLALEGAIFLVDDLKGPLVSFAPYYMLPIALSAWLLDRRITYLFVALSSLARVYVFSELLPPNNPLLYVYDTCQSAVLYSTIEILVWKIRQLTNRLATHASHLESHAKRTQQKRRLEASIRRALPEDVDEIIRLTILGAKDGGLHEQVLTTEWRDGLSICFNQSIVDGVSVRDIWTGGQAPVPVEIWVSVVNGNIAGFFMILGVDEKKGTERELMAIVVSDAYRGLGIGSAMADFFCSHFKNRRLSAACKPGSKMMAMLEKRGFKQVATVPQYTIIERPA